MRNIFFLLATLLLLSCNDAIKYDKYKNEEGYTSQRLAHYTWSPIHEEKNLVECLPF